MRLIPALLFVVACCARAEDSYSVLPDQQIPASVPVAAPAEADKGRKGLIRRDPDAYSIISAGRGLSTHKPMYVMPVTWSPDFDGKHTEVQFQISAKQRLFGYNLYFGYTQKSMWQLYNKKDSAPFRETDYNPEVFYRWTPDPAVWKHWGADIGFEHESNGKELPDSRSWNRIYIAPFQARGHHLAYFKFWYKLPERERTDPNDAEADDNPDIDRYMGYGELHFQRQFGRQQQAWLMLRGNPASGRGAVQLNYSWPSQDDSFFYCVNVWHGYGETLIDYNTSITRLGVGVMFAR